MFSISSYSYQIWS